MKKNLAFIAVMIPLLIFVGLRRNSAPFFSVKEYRCVGTELLSADYIFSINNVLRPLINDNCAAQALIVRLQETFPVLNKVVVSYRPSVVQVMMSAQDPICCINNAFILTDHNKLFPKNVFSNKALAAIAEVTVGQDSMIKAPVFVSSLLRGLPCDSNNAYNLELVNEHCVYFIDKKQPNFTIVSSLDQEKTTRLLAQCESVKRTIGERGGFDKGVKWVADTRFARYIVAYKV